MKMIVQYHICNNLSSSLVLTSIVSWNEILSTLTFFYTIHHREHEFSTEIEWVL